MTTAPAPAPAILADWYIQSAPTTAAAKAMAAWRGHARAMLLSGAPGVGKSAFAEALAEATGARLVVLQAHAWTDADELFVGVDVAAAVAGDAAAVRQDGAITRAVRLASEGPVVLLLDEMDKAPERAEHLLLDWLQSGRVPVRPGVQLPTPWANIVVIVTTNEVRPLGDALLRRLRRVHVPALPVEQQEGILTRATGLPAGLCRVAWRALREIGGAEISIQEGKRALLEIADAASVDEVREALSAWGARDAEGRDRARTCSRTASIWGLVQEARR